MSRVRLSLSLRDSEGSPSCVLGLLLTLSSNLVAIFIYWVVLSFPFFGWSLFFIRPLSSAWLPFPP